MTTTGLLSLPSEIRQQIWRNLFPSFEVIRVTTTWDPHGYQFQLYSEPVLPIPKPGNGFNSSTISDPRIPSASSAIPGTPTSISTNSSTTLTTLAESINDDFFHDLSPSTSWTSTSLTSLRSHFTLPLSLLVLNHQIHSEILSVAAEAHTSRILVLNDMMLDNTRVAISVVKALQFDILERHDFFALLVRCGRTCTQGHQYLISRLMEETWRFMPGREVGVGRFGVVRRGMGTFGNERNEMVMMDRTSTDKATGKDFSVTFRREERMSGMWWIRMVIRPWSFEGGEDEG